MRIFCIRTKEDPSSISGGKRCVESARKFDVDVELFDAVHFKNLDTTINHHGLKLKYTPVPGSQTDFVNRTAPRTRVGNGMTHFLLYKKCIELGENIIILEHDAIFASPPPTIDMDNAVVQICSHWENQLTPDRLHGSGRAQKMRKFGNEEDLSMLGINYQWTWPKSGLIKHPLSATLGTSGYIITPGAANKMVDYLTEDGIGFADRVRTEHIGRNNLYLQVPQSTTCRHIQSARTCAN